MSWERFMLQGKTSTAKTEQNYMKNKKAQEEMVGFIVIMLLVAIIFLIFLGIFLRKGPTKTESGETAQFLDALEEVTTECKVGFSYLNVRQLIKRCYEGGLCGGEDACDIAEKNIKSAIEKSWNFDSNSFTKAYRFEARYESQTGGQAIYLFNRRISKNVCSDNFRGAEKAISVGGGVILMDLELCY